MERHLPHPGALVRTILACAGWALLPVAAAHAQYGYVDGIQFSNGQFLVTGWACDPGSSSPVWVTLYAGQGVYGAADPGFVVTDALAAGWADLPSEAAVASACLAPGASALRFALPLSATAEPTLTGLMPWVLATSPGSLGAPVPLGAWIYNGASNGFPDTSIRGFVDSVEFDGNEVLVNGWACAASVPQSIAVHVYAGGAAGSGTFVGATVANQASEPAVAQACGVAGGAYRYSASIPFGPDMVFQFGGMPVYVHGISPVGASNDLLASSGRYSLPGQRASASGSCGYVPALWNAPYGAVVLVRSSGGPIRPVINALGEYYTHSMLSLGTIGIAQAEMRTPAQNSWPAVCSTPVDPAQLRFGYPGAERADLGAAYADLQGGEIAPVYQWGSPGAAAAIANWVVGQPQLDVPSRSTPALSIARILRNSSPVSYSLFQFRDIEGTNSIPSSASNNGMVCSTFLSYAHVQAGAGDVAPSVYAHPLIASAANALFAAVQAQCNGAFSFWSSIGLGVTCPFFDVCENAGDQVTNCMSSNVCDSNDNSIWHGVRDQPSTTATSVSPDRLAGRPPHGAGTTTWSLDQGYHPVLWNSPGAQYGCWE